MNLVGLLMCRDEADIIDATLTHVRSQGIGAILVIDNGSTDGTVEILEKHECIIWHDPELAYNQEQRMSRLANEPQALESDWIIPFDADEMWMGTNGRTISEVCETTGAVILNAANYRVWPDGKREPRPQMFPSVAFRPWPGAALAKGNHSVHRPGAAVDGELMIHEYQYRSFEQMCRKVRHGKLAIDAANWPDGQGAHWRRYGAMSDDELMNEWLALSTNPELIPIG